MGKIFDALKKSEQQSIITDAPRVTKKKAAKYNSIEKVVPFESSKRIHTQHPIDENIVVYHQPDSMEAEMFKVLKTNFLFPSEGVAPKTLLVTSALPGDGKSFVSANIAISIAKGIEEHVLLIDSDIRSPSINKIFGYEQCGGLNEYLTSGDDIANMLIKTSIDKLTILPAGCESKNPTELLSSKKMKKLVDEVKSRYDDRYIIIDSPPPALATETNAVAKYVDGIILVVGSGKTPRHAVEELIEQLGKEKIIGIVLNYCDKQTGKYYGYGGSYYNRKKE